MKEQNNFESFDDEIIKNLNKENSKEENLNKNAAHKHDKNMKNLQKNQKSAEKNQLKQDNRVEKNQKESQTKGNNSSKNRYKGAVIGLAIATGVLGLATIGTAVGWGVSSSQSQNYATEIENIYKKNYYELVDNTNSADTKISKLLASDNSTYQAKMLTELSQEAQDMQNNISALPLSGESILECTRFVNQLAGFCQTLEARLVQGGTLSSSDLETLNKIHESLTQMKVYLNEMSERMFEGYSILQASKVRNGELDRFNTDFGGIKASDADYPTMIYDGPFSDSVVDAKVVGLSGKEISKDEAYNKIYDVCKNIQNLRFEGQSNGKFETYNFSMENTDERELFVQVTKIGGNILTISGHVESDVANIDMEQGGKIALDFAKANGIDGGEIVWSEKLESQGFFNIAPTQKGIVLYPDLVKVKVDLEKGDVIGYDAISYFTNHTNRTLSSKRIGIDLAREGIDNSFKVQSQRICLAPLEYNREVMCYEFEATRDNATYYIYINTETGKEENILKVVETSDSSKLM